MVLQNRGLNFEGAPSTVEFLEPNPRANSEFLGQLEIPKPWKMKHISSSEAFQNSATPSTVGTLSFFGGAPFYGTARADYEILNRTGGNSDFSTTVRQCWLSRGSSEVGKSKSKKKKKIEVKRVAER